MRRARASSAPSLSAAIVNHAEANMPVRSRAASSVPAAPLDAWLHGPASRSLLTACEWKDGDRCS